MKKILLTTTALIALGSPLRSPPTLPHGPIPRRLPWRLRSNNWTGFYARAHGRLRIQPQSAGTTPVWHRYPSLAAMTQPAAPSVVRSATAGRTATVGPRPRSRRAPGRTSAVASIVHPGHRVPPITNDTRVDAFGTVRRPASATPSTTSSSTAPAATRGLTTAFRNGLPAWREHLGEQIHSGWTVGAGVEVMFAPKWSVKAEYLYRSFDRPDLRRRHRPHRHAQPQQRSARRELSLLRLAL